MDTDTVVVAAVMSLLEPILKDGEKQFIYT